MTSCRTAPAIIRNRFSADQIAARCRADRPRRGRETQLRAKYLAAAPRFDIYSTNGHSTHVAAGVPDNGNITAAEVAGAATDLSGALVYSLGCHAGLNDPGALDLPQAFAQKLANYVGNTGFGWGGSGKVYSEALMRNYTRELSARYPNVSIGPALAAAKRKYYSQSKTAFDAFDAKVLMQIDPLRPADGRDDLRRHPDAARIRSPAPGAFTPPPALGGLAQGRWAIDCPTSFGAFGEQTSTQGRTFDLDGNVEFQAGEPVQPQYFADVSAPTVGALHGVIFLGGVYTEVTGFNPVVALAENEYVVDKSEPAFARGGLLSCGALCVSSAHGCARRRRHCGHEPGPIRGRIRRPGRNAHLDQMALGCSIPTVPTARPP